jgi:hypothetical protein
MDTVAPPTKPWVWPLDVSQYNRESLLSMTEQRDLHSFLELKHFTQEAMCDSRHLIAASAALFDFWITSETESSAQSRLLVDGSNVGATQSELLEPIKSVCGFCTFGQVMPDFCTLGQDMLC